MSLAGKRVAVLAEFNVEDMELAYPRLRFLEEGCAVSVVGPKAKFKYAGKHGYPFVSDLSIDEARAEDFDCLIIPGGFAPDYWRRDERFKQLVRDMDEAGKYIGSICHGPWLLISAKVIKGRTVTCFHAIKDDVENAGATYVEGKEVVVDGNLVTSRTPDDLPAFCRTLIAMLSHQ